MTVRRKPDPQDPGKDSFEIKLGAWTLSWRTALFAAVLSSTPYGQQMLVNLGVPPPKVSSAALSKDVEELQNHTHNIERQISEVREDVALVKQDVKLVKNQITAFEVNFDKYKKTTNE